MPDDFCSVLGFFPTRSESPVSGCRGHESLQRHRRLAQHNKYFFVYPKMYFCPQQDGRHRSLPHAVALRVAPALDLVHTGGYTVFSLTKCAQIILESCKIFFFFSELPLRVPVYHGHRADPEHAGQAEDTRGLHLRPQCAR